MNHLELILLACAAAVYPTLLTGVVLILSRPNPLPLLVAFFAGGLAVSVGAGVVIVKTLESSPSISGPRASTRPIADIVIGAVSLALSWGVGSGRLTGAFLRQHRQARRRRSAQTPSFTARALGGGSVAMAVLAGLILNLPGIWYMDALVQIARGHTSTASAVLQILVFNLIMFVLVEAPIVAYLIEPQRATDGVARLRSWTSGHARQVASWVAGVVGAWLLVRGIVALA